MEAKHGYSIMKEIGDMAEKGWSLESFAFLGCRFRKTEPKKVIYSVDYRGKRERILRNTTISIKREDGSMFVRRGIFIFFLLN